MWLDEHKSHFWHLIPAFTREEWKSPILRGIFARGGVMNIEDGMKKSQCWNALFPSLRKEQSELPSLNIDKCSEFQGMNTFAEKDLTEGWHIYNFFLTKVASFQIHLWLQKNACAVLSVLFSWPEEHCLSFS